MLYKQKIENNCVSIEKTGRYFKVLKCQHEIKIDVYAKGQNILSTTVKSGFDVAFDYFDLITIRSENIQVQDIEVWAGNFRLNFDNVDLNATSLLNGVEVLHGGTKKIVSQSVRKAVNLIPNIDCFFGGANVDTNNGIPLKANEIFHTKVSGDVYIAIDTPEKTTLETGNFESIETDLSFDSNLQNRLLKVGGFMVSASERNGGSIYAVNLKTYALQKIYDAKVIGYLGSGDNWFSVCTSGDGVEKELNFMLIGGFFQLVTEKSINGYGYRRNISNNGFDVSYYNKSDTTKIKVNGEEKTVLGKHIEAIYFDNVHNHFYLTGGGNVATRPSGLYRTKDFINYETIISDTSLNFGWIFYDNQAVLYPVEDGVFINKNNILLFIGLDGSYTDQSVATTALSVYVNSKTDIVYITSSGIYRKDSSGSTYNKIKSIYPSLINSNYHSNFFNLGRNPILMVGKQVLVFDVEVDFTRILGEVRYLEELV